MKSEESGSTFRTAIQPPHLDFRRRSPSQDESAPVIGLSHRADSGGFRSRPKKPPAARRQSAQAAQARHQRARNSPILPGRSESVVRGSLEEYRIDRLPCLTNRRPQGFSLPTVFQPHIHAEPRHERITTRTAKLMPTPPEFTLVENVAIRNALLPSHAEERTSKA